jgi:uncharacterized protein (TIGR03067 family)
MSAVRSIGLAVASLVLLLPFTTELLGGDASHSTAAAEPKIADEISKLGGRWRVVKVEMNGEPRQEDFTITFKDGRFTRKGKTKTYTGSYELDSSARPRKIIVVKDEDPRHKPLPGIYELEGDTLKICYGKIRPTEFATKPGQNAMLLVLRHESGSNDSSEVK